jgi:hypothetical protein
MHGICFDYSLQEWFKIPKQKSLKILFSTLCQEPEDFKINHRQNRGLGGKPFVEEFTKSKRKFLGNDEFNFPRQKGEFQHSN